jgi:hypothetical protein
MSVLLFFQLTPRYHIASIREKPTLFQDPNALHFHGVYGVIYAQHIEEEFR